MAEFSQIQPSAAIKFIRGVSDSIAPLIKSILLPFLSACLRERPSPLPVRE